MPKGGTDILADLSHIQYMIDFTYPSCSVCVVQFTAPMDRGTAASERGFAVKGAKECYPTNILRVSQVRTLFPVNDT